MTLYEQLAKITYSTDCYISGMRALNIADFENHTGDWHRTVFWQPESTVRNSNILGKDSPTASFDTNYYFGSEGIFNADSTFRRMGIPHFTNNVLAANHARAIADLVLYCALQEKNPWLLIDCYSFDDYMELDSDKQKVYKLLDKALSKLEGKPKQIVENWLQAVQKVEYE